MPSLYKSLKLSYGSKNTQQKEMKREGYQFDSMLSNGNQQVYFNPSNKKLLVSIAGTHNLRDIGTDIYLGMGHLKDTNRYKEADRVLHQAKTKYGVSSASVVGHSLGSSIGAYVSSANDKFTGLDGGYTIGQKTRSYNGNHENYRTQGDLVSIMGANATNMKTIKNPNVKTGVVIMDALRAHNVENIKNTKINV